MSVQQTAAKIRAGGHTTTISGTVESLREHYDDATKIQVSIRMGPRPPKPKKGEVAIPSPRTEDVVVPLAFGQKLRIGQKLNITTETVAE